MRFVPNVCQGICRCDGAHVDRVSHIMPLLTIGLHRGALRAPGRGPGLSDQAAVAFRPFPAEADERLVRVPG